MSTDEVVEYLRKNSEFLRNLNPLERRVLSDPDAVKKILDDPLV